MEFTVNGTPVRRQTFTEAQLDAFLAPDTTPAPVVPFQSEIDTTLAKLAAGDFHGAAVIRESLFQQWRAGVEFTHEALDRLNLLAADVLNINIVVGVEWSMWLQMDNEITARCVANMVEIDRRQCLPVLVSAEYAVAVEIETGVYGHHVAMSDAFADRTDEDGVFHCRYHMVKSAQSLQCLQRWAADPSGYDFSEFSVESEAM